MVVETTPVVTPFCGARTSSVGASPSKLTYARIAHAGWPYSVSRHFGRRARSYVNVRSRPGVIVPVSVTDQSLANAIVAAAVVARADSVPVSGEAEHAAT